MKDSKSFSFQFIQNTYDAEETLELLNELIDKKTVLIESQINSLKDRYVLTSPFLEERLNHLRQAKTDLHTFFSNIHSDEYDVKVDCPINIELSRISNPTEKEKINANPLSELV